MQILDKQNGYHAFPSCATRLDTDFYLSGFEAEGSSDNWSDSNALLLVLTELNSCRLSFVYV